MKIHINIFTFLIMIFVNVKAYAHTGFTQIDTDGLLASDCVVASPEKPTIAMPKHFEFTNNLVYKATSFEPAKGDKIAIFFRVMDQKCQPIYGAKLSLWQANSYGFDQIHSIHHKHKIIDPNFSGTGTTITDNLGRAEFFTIFPGQKDNSLSNFNLMVEAYGFNPITSKIYLKNMDMNKSDHEKELYKAAKKRILAIDNTSLEDNNSSGLFSNSHSNKKYMMDVILSKKNH